MLRGSMLLTAMRDDSHVVEDATDLLRLSHNLERISDPCVNVSERTLQR